MGTEYEERLRTRARALADLYDIRQDTLACLGAARHAGSTGRTDRPGRLRRGARANSIETYTAGDGWTGRHADEPHFLGHVASIEDDIEDRYTLRRAARHRGGHRTGDRPRGPESARGQLARARTRLATAKAMPTFRPCDGCHGRRAAAIDAAEEAIEEAQRRIAECQKRIAICEGVRHAMRTLRVNLQSALARIRAVPGDLGDTYESVYRLIRHGGRMPYEGRWITGETPIPA